jgi:hypothetical protein
VVRAQAGLHRRIVMLTHRTPSLHAQPLVAPLRKASSRTRASAPAAPQAARSLAAGGAAHSLVRDCIRTMPRPATVALGVVVTYLCLKNLDKVLEREWERCVLPLAAAARVRVALSCAHD